MLTAKNIDYCTSEKPPLNAHCLDIYHVRGKQNLPVLIFIHGGGWSKGNKDQYRALGKSFAGEGIITVIINYRLSPAVVHPEHARDCGAAFDWVCRNIERYGGDRKRIFISGHSAGGHLAALLATDDRYLKKYGYPLSAVAGVIPISGVYIIGAPKISGEITGRMITEAFTANKEIWKDASPISHVRRDISPMAIIYGEKEYLFIRENSRAFYNALKREEAPVRLREMEGKTHLSIIMDAMSSNGALHRYMVEFITSAVHR